MRSKLILTVACGLALFAGRSCAQQVATNLSPKFAPVSPFASLVAVAQTNGISLAGIDVPNAGTNLNIGDTATLLITLFEKDSRRTQWLLHLQAVAPTAKEKAMKPPPPMTMPSRKGGKFEFASSPTWVSLRTLGPFIEPTAKRKPPKVENKLERFALNEGFLRLGFDRAAKFIQWAEALKDSQATNRLPAGVTKEKDFEATLDKLFSQEDERAVAGAGPALMCFYEIVQHTSGLEGILYDLIDKPSVWSVVKNLGVTANVELPSERIVTVNPAPWAVPGTNTAYTFPLTLLLNKQPGLKVNFVVTAPQPPLLSSAGVIAMLAERPDDKNHYLTLRILSARLAKIAP